MANQFYNTGNTKLLDNQSNPVIVQGSLAQAYTPTNGVDIPVEGGANVYIGGTGNLEVVMYGDSTNTAVVFNNIAEGVVHPIKVKRVLATNTTATNIVLVY